MGALTVMLAGGTALLLGGAKPLAAPMAEATPSADPAVVTLVFPTGGTWSLSQRALGTGLSVLVPGVGHLYGGDWARGLLYMGGVSAAYGLAYFGGSSHRSELALGGAILIGAITLASPVDYWLNPPSRPRKGS